MKNENNKMRDLKMILQKNDLLISQIKRIRYGPYTEGVLKQGDISEADLEPKIKTTFFQKRKKQLSEYSKNLEKKVEKIYQLKQKQNEVLNLNRINMTKQIAEKYQKDDQNLFDK